MEEKIKSIVAQYIKLPPDQINNQTAIDRSSAGSSIVLHRLYGSLANEGIVVTDYLSVKNFGELLAKTGGEAVEANETLTKINRSHMRHETELPGAGIGIDIEEINAMPAVNDYRSDAFYQMNFSPAEISYCILQPHPTASFAGLFAAKEAIVKADSHYIHTPFNEIEIDHLPKGKPYHKNIQLSISHTHHFAIAVAVLTYQQSSSHTPKNTDPVFPNFTILLLAVAALLTAIFALFVSYFR